MHLPPALLIIRDAFLARLKMPNLLFLHVDACRTGEANSDLSFGRPLPRSRRFDFERRTCRRQTSQTFQLSYAPRMVLELHCQMTTCSEF